ncbi:MAG: hypothetical protein LQ347_006956, partial [Umbilicaria vellea]
NRILYPPPSSILYPNHHLSKDLRIPPTAPLLEYQTVVGEYSAANAIFGSTTLAFAGLVARLSDGPKKELGSGGVGGIGAVTDAYYVAPMKPPVWTGKKRGIDVETPPICAYCSADLEVVEEIIQSKQDSETLKEAKEDDAGEQTPSEATAAESTNSLQASERILQGVTELEEQIGSDETVEYQGRGQGKRRNNIKHEDTTVKKRKDNRRGSIVQRDKEQLEATRRPRGKEDALEPLDEQSPPPVRPTHVSVIHPLDAIQSFLPSNTRALPKWMAHLPSNRRSSPADVQRPSAPVRLPSQVALISAPPSPEPLPTPANAYHTPLEHPAETGGVAASKPGSRMSSAQPPRQSSSYPFFQHPRAPLTPAAESSWNAGGSSPGLMPFNPAGAETVIIRRPVLRNARQDRSFLSMEYLEKYSPKTSADEGKLPDVQICPVCETAVVEAESLKASNSKIYHQSCFRCQICPEEYGEYGKMSEWMFVKQLPYHQTCLSERAKPMADRLKSRITKPLPPTPLDMKARPSSPLAMAALVPIRKSSLNVLRPRPEYLRELSAFFSTGKKQQLPKLGGIIDTCAGCGNGVPHLESVPGP